MSEHPASWAVCDIPKGLILPSSILSHELRDRGWEETGRAAGRTPEGMKNKRALLTVAASIKKPQGRCFTCGSPHGAPSATCASSPTPCGWFSAHTPDGDSQEAHAESQPASGGRGEEHRLELQRHPGESRREAIGTWPGVMQSPEKAHKRKNSAIRGARHGAGVSTGGLRKPQNPYRADRKDISPDATQ